MYTYLRKREKKLQTFRPARARKANSKRAKAFTSNVSVNYALMLQLYYLNKQQAASQKELKYTSLSPVKSAYTLNKQTVPFGASVISKIIKAYDFISKDTKAVFNIITD